MPDKSFWDTNLWVYLNTDSQTPADAVKKATLEALLFSMAEIVVSAQVLNELANVLMKKYGQSESSLLPRLEAIMEQADTVAMTGSLTILALKLKSKYQLAWFDSLIAAAALQANCNILYSEDFQDGLVIEGKLKVINPIKP